MTNPDLERMRAEYASRELDQKGKDAYSFFNPAHLFTIQQRQRAVLDALKNIGLTSLQDAKILEIGCGSGGVLAELVAIGADPKHLAGIELLRNRLVEANHRLPSTFFVEADGQNLPLPSTQFDLVLQFTAFSSILDPAIRQNVAQEMLRVVKADGAILWYDFWWNPTNRQTRGITPNEIRSLFPGCACKFHRVTLAPPITRRIIPISWTFALLLENLRLFNTHFLAIIRSRE